MRNSVRTILGFVTSCLVVQPSDPPSPTELALPLGSCSTDYRWLPRTTWAKSHGTGGGGWMEPECSKGCFLNFITSKSMTVYFLLLGEPGKSNGFFCCATEVQPGVCLLKSSHPIRCLHARRRMALAKQLLFPWQCCQVLRWRRKQRIESHVISYHHMNEILCHHVISIGGTYLRYPPLPFKCVSYQQSQHLDTAPVCATSSHGHLLGHLSVFHGVMEVCLSNP